MVLEGLKIMNPVRTGNIKPVLQVFWFCAEWWLGTAAGEKERSTAEVPVCVKRVPVHRRQLSPRAVQETKGFL